MMPSSSIAVEFSLGGYVERFRPPGRGVLPREATLPYLQDLLERGGCLDGTLVVDSKTYPVHPFDLGARLAEFDVKYELGFDVTMSWSIVDLGSPFGDLWSTFEVVNGILVRCEVLPRQPSVDILFGIPFERRIRARSGVLESVLETLAPPATLDGDLELAMVLGGLLDGNQWREFSVMSSETARAHEALRLACGGGQLVLEQVQ